MWGYLQVETLCLWGWESVKIILSTKKVWEMETVAQRGKSQTSLWSQLHFSGLSPSSEIALYICILSWCLNAGGISFRSSYSFHFHRVVDKVLLSASTSEGTRSSQENVTHSFSLLLGRRWLLMEWKALFDRGLGLCVAEPSSIPVPYMVYRTPTRGHT